MIYRDFEVVCLVKSEQDVELKLAATKYAIFSQVVKESEDV